MKDVGHDWPYPNGGPPEYARGVQIIWSRYTVCASDDFFFCFVTHAYMYVYERPSNVQFKRPTTKVAQAAILGVTNKDIYPRFSMLLCVALLSSYHPSFSRNKIRGRNVKPMKAKEQQTLHQVGRQTPHTACFHIRHHWGFIMSQAKAQQAPGFGAADLRKWHQTICITSCMKTWSV
jgi:hypothetical protein